MCTSSWVEEGREAKGCSAEGTSCPCFINHPGRKGKKKKKEPHRNLAKHSLCVCLLVDIPSCGDKRPEAKDLGGLCRTFPSCASSLTREFDKSRGWGLQPASWVVGRHPAAGSAGWILHLLSPDQGKYQGTSILRTLWGLLQVLYLPHRKRGGQRLISRTL